MFLCQRVGKIQALLVFCFGFACRQKPNVLECVVGIISLSFTLFTVVVFLALAVTVTCMVSFGDSEHEPVKPLQCLLSVPPLKSALSAKCTIHDVVPSLFLLPSVRWNRHTLCQAWVLALAGAA